MTYLTYDPIVLEPLLNEVRVPRAGAEVVFIGTIRDHSQDKKVIYLEYESHESLANKMIDNIIQETYKKWDIHKIALLHRLGRLQIGEISIIICVSSSHRDESFQACRYLIDEIKKKVPIWKKEFDTSGAHWSSGIPLKTV